MDKVFSEYSRKGNSAKFEVIAMSCRRPEHQAPPEIFYDETEARKYTTNSRMIDIQVQMSERALELLGLPDDKLCLVADLGCGSGLSGEVIEEQGHMWIGVDISPAMLNIAREREVEGDLILGDLGEGLCFRAGVFDGAISVSALQWLCNADKNDHKPHIADERKKSSNMSSDQSKRDNNGSYLTLLSDSPMLIFQARGARAVFQFYPENSAQIELITAQSMKAGFSGGLVVDYPHSSKAKKFFLVLMTGGPQQLPKALGDAETAEVAKAKFTTKREKMRGLRQGKSVKGSKSWIMQKKERRRLQGKEVKADSKYSARKRPGHF
ncbi:unnamed protein product [Notodromas monacha]|uniref:18S rRNA (Guanine-N(7))-methyltransferase n=1 Tax=Notodromas monacha TaxID=399045 RepID=A0A7R9BPW3_9CRUS|nr:unnamed protein product [Notodromas monacha]CAG0919501.1 unnamed protein product [Notodromas monacha]